MKHHHGISVSLTSATRSSIDEYIDPSFKRPRGLKGELDKAQIIASPGEDFRVNLSFEDFRLYSGEGVAVVIACGHGDDPPGGFEHVQYYWIDGKFLVKCSPWHFDGYEVWNEKRSSTNFDLPFTMPVSYDGAEVSDTPRLYQSPFQPKVGSVTAFVQRGTVLNRPEDYYFPVLRYEKTKQGMETFLHTRTDAPRANVGMFERLPVTIARNWFDPIGGKNGHPYVFEFTNTDAASVNPATLQLRPDSGMVQDIHGNNAEEDESGWDTEDAWSLYDSEEDDPNHALDDSSDSDSDHEFDNAESQDDIEEIRAYCEADMQRQQLVPVLHSRTRLQRHYRGSQAPALVGNCNSGRFATPELQGQGQDDEEALPAKLEGADAADLTSRSPGMDRVPAAPIVIARNAKVVSKLSQSQSTGAGALNATFATPQPSPTVAVAPMESDLAEVRRSTPRHMARAPSPIDLTMDDDDLAVPIKREPNAQGSSLAAAGRHGTELHLDEEDLDDLEDELKEIQARRRLRAARKRKLAEMKSES
ncbi:hypothetical protein LTR22_002521 [Elasticomyces elasticus]|nr:hypothetical protein LTR22_002521 [Elasticomyces elasticus]KAK4928290.1 hypothetical protein LTR49_004967 [Elasticomyces elasticus]